MPNWCETDLEFRFDTIYLDNFMKFLHDYFTFEHDIIKFDNHKFMPVPDNRTQYATWGSKWGICDIFPSWQELREQIEEQKAHRRMVVMITLTSAWNEPEQIFVKMSELLDFAELRVAYFEAGVGFSGRYTLSKGIKTKEFINEEYTGSRGG